MSNDLSQLAALVQDLQMATGDPLSRVYLESAMAPPGHVTVGVSWQGSGEVCHARHNFRTDSLGPALVFQELTAQIRDQQAAAEASSWMEIEVDGVRQKRRCYYNSIPGPGQPRWGIVPRRAYPILGSGERLVEEIGGRLSIITTKC